MASKPQLDDEGGVPLLPRCIAIVLKERKQRKNDSKHLDREHGRKKTEQETSHGLTGKALFDKFQEENKECYWNPHLEESVKNLKFLGCLHPSTLLLGGRDIYLDTVKNGWARKVLRAPPNFNMAQVCEVASVDMKVVHQTQFTPLPEALCLTISELSRDGTTPTLENIQDRLQDKFQGMQQPSEHVVYETLDMLMKERKIYHTGNGYQIVTPETFQFNHLNNAGRARVVFGEDNRTHLPTIYIPLGPNNVITEMRSISCQTENKENLPDETSVEKTEEVEDEEEKGTEKRKSRLERTYSLKSSRGKDKREKADSFQRSSSVRYGEESAKAIVKDINLKTSDAHQDKDKAANEKTSLFNKVFGRKKKSSSKAEQENQKEYATFSAQFPPPEWLWFEQQSGKAVEPPQQSSSISKAQTWHHQVAPPRFMNDICIQSDLDEEEGLRSSTLPVNLQSISSQRPTRSSSSQSYDSQASGREAHVTHPKKYSKDRSESRGSRSKSARRKSDREKRSSQRHSMKFPEQEECNESQKSHTDSNIYCEPEMFTGPPGMTSTPYNNDQPLYENLPFQNRQHNASMESHQMLNNMMPGEQEYAPVASQSKRNSRYQEMRCPPFCGNDLTIEYHGKLPKKGAGYSMSRDSGVNCIGLDSSGKAGDVRGQPQRAAQGSVTLLNNQCRQSHHNYENNQVAHQATVHVPEYLIHQQDSGFSSPRTDPDESSNLYQQINNLSFEQCNNSENNNMQNSQAGQQQNEKCITNEAFHRETNNNARFENTQKHSKKLTHENKSAKRNATSMETLTITGSEIYPPYVHMTSPLDKEGSLTPSSSWSGSSKQTVLERFPQMPVQMHPGSPRKMHPSPLVKDEPYLELKVAHDCPFHGENSQVQGQVGKGHEKSPRKSKHRSLPHGGGKQCPVHKHPGDRQTNRNESVRRSLTDKMVAAMNDHQRAASQKGHDHRLAFLGDVEVVGIV